MEPRSPPSGDGSGADSEANERSTTAFGLDRRELVKTAMLVGGTSALGTLTGCLGRGTGDGSTSAARLDGEQEVGSGTDDRISAGARSNRQHAWDDYESTVGTGNTVQPAASLFLMLEYAGEGTPTADHRKRVETALREIERSFEWNSEGVLFTMSYSAAYFDRFEEDLPAGAAPMPADDVADRASAITPYDPDPDSHDAFLLLSSDHPANLLAIEEALWGNGELGFEATFEGVFEKPSVWPNRRVGFAGPLFQDREDVYENEYLPDDADVPDEAPLSMGFVAGFEASIPREEVVTLKQGMRFPNDDIDAADVPTDLDYVGEVGERDPGVFAQGTLKHYSYLAMDLGADEGTTGWYDVDIDRRRSQIYSPFYDRDGERGVRAKDGLKPGSRLTKSENPETERVGPGFADFPARSYDHDDYASKTVETAVEGTDLTGGEPTAGHSQKAARARYDVTGVGDPQQPTLRRDWDGIRPAENGYTETAGYHFNVPMRFNESIFTLLHANYRIGFTSLDGRIDHDGVDTAAGLLDEEKSGMRNGLVPFMEATRRNNWLVPPVTVRALPFPRADSVSIESVEEADGEYRVTVSGLTEDDIDNETVRFGQYRAVNRAGGASLAGASGGEGGLVLRFAAADTGIDGDTERVKLFAKRAGDWKPVTGEFQLN